MTKTCWRHISASIAAVRQAFPFSSVNQRPMLDTIPQLSDVSQAVKMYQRPKDFFGSEYYMRLHERADWQGSPAALRLFTWRFMRALRARGLPFYVHTCYRNPDIQMSLHAHGRTQVKSGAHQRACAVDIVSAIDHWEIPDELWHYLGTLGDEVARSTFLGKDMNGDPLKIEWGGRWDFYDPAHWQLSDWRARATVTEAEPIRVSPYSDQMRFG